MAKAKPGVSTQNQSTEKKPKGGKLPEFRKLGKGPKVTHKSK